MVDDELPTNDNAEPVIPPGPRRSTFTPPPSDATYDPSATDDDALAGALSQQFTAWKPAPAAADDDAPVAAEPPIVAETEPAAPVTTSPESTPFGAVPHEPTAWEPAPWQPAAEEPPAWQPAANEPPAWQAAAAESAASAFPTATAPEPEPFATRPPKIYDLTGMGDPAPSGASAAPSAGPAAPTAPAAPGAPTLPPPPQRMSLTDAELLEAANLDAPGQDTSSILDLVERELVLRQIEAQRLAEWEKQVRASAAPEADEVVTQVREKFTGVVPVIPTATPEDSAEPALSVAEQLASAPPPAPPQQFATPPAAPLIDLALADAPPPYGIVPSAAVAPPPSVPAPSDETWQPPASFAPEPPAFEPATEPPAFEPATEPPAFEPAPVAPPVWEVTPEPELQPAWDVTPEPAPLVEPEPLAAPTFAQATSDLPPLGVPPVAIPGADLAAGVVPAAPAAAALAFEDLLREPAPTEAEDSSAAVSSAGVSSWGPTSEGAGDHEASELDAFAQQFGGASVIDTAPPPSMSVDGESGDAIASEVVPVGPRAGRVEVIALEPTPAEQRAGRSVRLFWLWFAVNSSVVSVALGAVILGLGVSLRQAVLATLIGVALSFLPLGLGTLAGRWSGQPTMVVSRATFGTAGNLIPALLALVTRLAWAAALLWMLGAGVAEVLVGSGLVGGLGRLELTIAAASVGLVVAALVATFGFALISVVSAIVSVVSGVLVVGLIALTARYVDLDAALALPDGDWLLLLSGAVLVFSVVGLAWANSSGDLARYQAKGTSGSAAVLFSTFGATLPAFALICWGALLAASNPVLAEGLAENPMDLVSRLLPLWYPAPLVAAIALSLISAAALALYSAGFALLATGMRASRPASVIITTVLSAALVALLIVIVPNPAALFGDIVTTLAVPVAAWAGIFGAETMIRTRRVHSPSLLRSGGVYPAIRWLNVLMLLLITAVGWGFSTATLVGLQWQGYLFSVLGVDLDSVLASSDPGVLVALVLGLLTPIIMGIPAIRKLQRAEHAATEAEAAADAATGALDTADDGPAAATVA